MRTNRPMSRKSDNGRDKNLLTRREFLRVSAAAGGGLLLSLALPLPGVLAGEGVTFEPDAHIRIDSDGVITLIVPRVEMGQGTYTALPLLVAEELEVDPLQMRLEHAPASDRLYANPMSGFQNTGGSTSIRAHWAPLRRAGAAARMMLVQAAAKNWGVASDECHARDGRVIHRLSGRTAAYGALAGGAALLPVPADVTIKSPDEFRRIGLPIHRLDGAEKVNGTARFGIDARPEGVKTAAILSSPLIGGRVRHVVEDEALATPGVLQVVSLDSAVAVIADHYHAARKGIAALRIDWDEGPRPDYSSERLTEELSAASIDGVGAVSRNEGGVDEAMAAPNAKLVSAIYEQPLLAHACMEPVNCTVHVRQDSCELWLGTQVPSRAQSVAAEITGLDPESIIVHNHLLGGGFGRRLDVDYVAQAVRIACQTQWPVKVVWSREEDTRSGTFRPSHYNRLSASLDTDGLPTAWRHRVTGSSVLARWAPARFQNNLDGDAIRDASGPYAFPNVLVDYVRQEPAEGIVTGFWRGVGHMQNAFPVECFMDELAFAADVDPIAYRKRMLSHHPRAIRVLEEVAARSGWGRELAAGKGLGVALTYCFGSYGAQVAEVTVAENGTVHVDRVTSVIDCGLAISPDTVVAQMEGGTVFGLSAVLFGDITIRDGRIEQGNFDTYRIMRMNEAPEQDVHVVPSQEDPGGVGEVSTVTIGPAVVNAVFAATGKRVRKLPIRPPQLSARA